MDHSSCNSVTIFTAISKYAIVVLELVTEFIKTMFEHFGRSVAFVRAMVYAVCRTKYRLVSQVLLPWKLL